MKKMTLGLAVFVMSLGALWAGGGGPAAHYDPYYSYFDAVVGYLSQLDCEADVLVAVRNCEEAGLKLDYAGGRPYSFHQKSSYWYWRIFFLPKTAPKGALLLYDKSNSTHYVSEAEAINEMNRVRDLTLREAATKNEKYIQLQMETFPVFDEGHLKYWKWELYYALYNLNYGRSTTNTAAPSEAMMPVYEVKSRVNSRSNVPTEKRIGLRERSNLNQ